MTAAEKRFTGSIQKITLARYNRRDEWQEFRHPEPWCHPGPNYNVNCEPERDDLTRN